MPPNAHLGHRPVGRWARARPPYCGLTIISTTGISAIHSKQIINLNLNENGKVIEV